MEKPGHFTTDGNRYIGTLKRIRVEETITDGRGRRFEARIAIFDVHVPGNYRPWEYNRSLYQLMCNFEQSGAVIEMTPGGNVLFKSGSITGFIQLSEQTEPMAEDPTETDHREPGTQHL